MTVRERVLASRLIEKTESHESYAKQIGLSGQIIAAGKDAAESYETCKVINFEEYRKMA